jgi:hypothetical protein
VAFESLVPNRLECQPKSRHGSTGSLYAPLRQAVEDQIYRPSRLLSNRWRSAGCFGHRQHTRVSVPAPGVHSRPERLEICLTRRSRVESFEPLGRTDEQVRTIATAIEDERDLRAQALHSGALRLVQRGELRGREQILRGLATTCGKCGPRSSERAFSSSCGVRGQLDSLLQECSRGHDTAPTLGTVG